MTTNRVLISLGDRELGGMKMNRRVCILAYIEGVRREKEVIYGAMMTAYQDQGFLTLY